MVGGPAPGTKVTVAVGTVLAVTSAVARGPLVLWVLLPRWAVPTVVIARGGSGVAVHVLAVNPFLRVVPLADVVAMPGLGSILGLHGTRGLALPLRLVLLFVFMPQHLVLIYTMAVGIYTIRR